MTLRLHDLPEFFGIANFRIGAALDDAYRRLIHAFVSFYTEHLFNHHWGEQVHFTPDNSLGISMVAYGLDTGHGQGGLAAVFGLGGALAWRVFDRNAAGFRERACATFLGRAMVEEALAGTPLP